MCCPFSASSEGVGSYAGDAAQRRGEESELCPVRAVGHRHSRPDGCLVSLLSIINTVAKHNTGMRSVIESSRFWRLFVLSRREEEVGRNVAILG